MATYTDANGVKLITTGDEAGTWGSSTNVNLQILDRAANGFESIALSSTGYNLTLSAQPSSAENGHYKAIQFTGSPGGTCTVTLEQNDKARVYMILNSTDEALIIYQGSGGSVTIEVGKGAIVLADGAGATASVTDFTAAVQNVTDLSSPFNVGTTSVTTSGAELNLLDGSTAGAINNSKAVIYGSSGEVNATTLQVAGTSITATAAELNFVAGVTSAIQTQIDAKQPLGTVAVTVSNPGAGNRYYIDGSLQQTVEIKPSVTYRFNQSDSSNSGHPLRFSTTSDGTHGGGSEFTTGVTTVGTPGSSGAYTQVKLEQDAPIVLYYYCSVHSGMGGKAVVRMSDLTASRALISDSGGDIAVSGVTTTELDILDGLTATTAELNIMDGVTASTTELNYVDGVTSDIQTQINGKIDGSSLNASNLDSGTVNDARLPASISSDITGNAATATTAAALTGDVTKTGDFTIDATGIITLDNTNSSTSQGEIRFAQNGQTTMTYFSKAARQELNGLQEISMTGNLTVDSSSGNILLEKGGVQNGRIHFQNSNTLILYAGTGQELTLTSSGANVHAGLRVGDTTTPTDNDIYAVADIEAGNDVTAGADVAAGSDVTAGGVLKLTSGSSDWTIDVDSNELFLKYGGASKAKIPNANSVVGYLGEQSSSTWTTGTGTTESLISPTKLRGVINNQLNITGSAPAFAVRAFVKFAGDGSVSANQTISASGNVASVFKNSSGNFTVTFDTAMPDEHYCITYVNQFGTTARDDAAGVMDVYAQSASAFSFTTADASSNSYQNYIANFITIVR